MAAFLLVTVLAIGAFLVVTVLGGGVLLCVLAVLFVRALCIGRISLCLASGLDVVVGLILRLFGNCDVLQRKDKQSVLFADNIR